MIDKEINLYVFDQINGTDHHVETVPDLDFNNEKNTRIYLTVKLYIGKGDVRTNIKEAKDLAIHGFSQIYRRVHNHKPKYRPIIFPKFPKKHETVLLVLQTEYHRVNYNEFPKISYEMPKKKEKTFWKTHYKKDITGKSNGYYLNDLNIIIQ